MFLHNFILEIGLSVIQEQSVKTTLYTLLIILQGTGEPWEAGGYTQKANDHAK